MKISCAQLAIYIMKILYFNHRSNTLSNNFTRTLRTMKEIQLKDIDWNSLWKKAKSKKSWKSKGVEDWDRKAESFSKRNARSDYNEKFITLLQPEKSWTLLDIGSGPGTLAIPLAERVFHVTALDFSSKMLAILKQRANRRGQKNISTHNFSWEDDWKEKGVRVHDVAIASRSLAVKDLRPALEKLNSFARKGVFITDRVGHGPFDQAAFKAVGRELKTGPDYIYTFNLLYQMGIRAKVNFIHLGNQSTYSSLDNAVENNTWMFQNLTADEKKRLKKYIQSITTTANDGTVTVTRKHIPIWAFISWQPEAK